MNHYKKRELSISQKQGVITLIEKEGKNPLNIPNYRPITLLNVDYKILSKVLANRIKDVLGEIVHSDQVGYIKDRNSGEAARLIDDMFFHSENNSNEFLIAVDFEKAFDSGGHDFLFEVLELFGFGVVFCTWVKIMYTDIIRLDTLVLSGGVRQGDPLSPYLFLLAIEILANTIRNDNKIKGFRFGEHEIKQILYADDFTLFIKDRSSVKRVKYIFEEFEKVSGLKVNNNNNIQFLETHNTIKNSLYACEKVNIKLKL